MLAIWQTVKPETFTYL